MLGIDPRTARITWTVALIVAGLAALYLARTTLFVFALALFLSYVLDPLVRLVDRYRMPRIPRAVSVAAAFAVVLAVIALALILTGPLIVDQATQLSDQLPNMLAMVRAGAPLPLPRWLEPWREPVTGLLRQGIEGAAASALPFTGQIVHSIGSIANDLVYIALIPILAFIILADGAALSRGLVNWLAPSDRRAIVLTVLGEVHQALGRYVRALGLLSLATVVSYAVFFSVAGVPYGVVLAVIAALLEFIPLIGPLAAAAIVLLVAGVAGYAHLLWIVAFIALYRIFQDYILSPRLMSGGAGVPPILVIFGFLAGGEIGGVPGMFLSVPIIAIVSIVVRYADRRVK